MTAIGPGSLLVCMKEAQHVPVGAELTVGAIYRCEAVITSFIPCPSDGCGHEGIMLIERPRDLYSNKIFIGGVFEVRVEAVVQPMYCPNIFRPLDDGDTSLVEDESLLEVILVDLNMMPARPQKEPV